MENKEIITSGKMTQKLIGNWLLYMIFFEIVYKIIYSLIISSIEDIIISILVAMILHGIFVILVWKCSTSSSFKKKTISYEDISIVMKNLIIFTIIVCIINTIYNISNVNSIMDEYVDSSYELKISESMMSYLYDEEEMAEYEYEKEKAIVELKKQIYIYLILLEIGLTAVYLAVLPLEKRFILKYVRKE